MMWPPSSTTTMTTVDPRLVASASAAAAILFATFSVSTGLTGSSPRALGVKAASRREAAKFWRVFIGVVLSLSRFDHVVQKWIGNLLEPMRNTGRDDDHVALVELARITAADRFAAEFIRRRVLEVHSGAAGNQSGV